MSAEQQYMKIEKRKPIRTGVNPGILIEYISSGKAAM